MTLACTLALVLAPVVPPAAQGRVLVVDDGAVDRGAVWTVDLRADGALESPREIADGVFGLDGLHDRDAFGAAIAGLGDLDGNGAVDLAVGAPGEGSGSGAVWILFRAPDGSVAAQRALRPGRDGIAPLAAPASFGASLALLGDLDGNGTPELAVGAPATSGGGEVRILSLSASGGVAREVVVGDGSGGFGGDLQPADAFGTSLAAVGDFDGDGVADLAVGAPGRSSGTLFRCGALWLLRLAANGSVVSESELSGTASSQALGLSLCALGDVDADGTVDLAAGSSNSFGTGSVWVLRMRPDWTRLDHRELRSGSAGFPTTAFRGLGASVAPLDDLDGDGVVDLLAGAPGNASVPDSAVFLVFLRSNGAARSALALAAPPGHAPDDRLGAALAALGDLDADGHPDLVLGASSREGLTDPGADHATLQAGIDAAAEGDTLLVREGRYAPGTIEGRALDVIGDRSWYADGVERRVELASVLVRDLAASQSVVLSGFSRGALLLVNSDGLVWIEDFDGEHVWVEDCADVVLVRSSFSGASADPFPGLAATDASTVLAYECSFVGGDGRCVSFGAQGGMPGVWVYSDGGTRVLLSGCTATGGSGIACSDPFYGHHCASGGAGVSAHASQPLRMLDSIAVGGPDGGCGAGPDHLGIVERLAGDSLAFSTELAREGEDVVFAFRGTPGAEVWLMGSPSARLEERPAQHGWRLLGTPRAVEHMGTLDASGALDVLVPLGLLAPGFDVRRTFLQPFMIEGARPGPGGKPRAAPSRVTLGAGSAFLVLDGAF